MAMQLLSICCQTTTKICNEKTLQFKTQKKLTETKVPAASKDKERLFREHCEQLLALVKKLEAKASSEEG
jgi:hypothetical protein